MGRRNNPFTAEDDEGATGSEDIERQAPETDGAERAPDDEAGTITLSLEDEDEDEDEEQQPQTRQGKKRARREDYRQTIEQNRQLQERLEAQGRQLQELSATLAHTQGWVQGRQGPQGDPYDAAIQATYDDEQALAAQVDALGRANPELVRQQEGAIRRRLQEIHERRTQLQYERHEQRMAPQRIQQQQQEYIRALAAQHPDVFETQERRTWLHARYMQLLALGSPNAQTTVDRAIKETREAFRLSVSRERPTRQQQAHFAGTPVGGVAAAARPGPGARSFTMTRQHQRAAEMMYPGMDQKAAWKRWAKEVGPEYLRMQQEEEAGPRRRRR